jgi:hypothetical protein
VVILPMGSYGLPCDPVNDRVCAGQGGRCADPTRGCAAYSPGSPAAWAGHPLALRVLFLATRPTWSNHQIANDISPSSPAWTAGALA